MSRKIHNRSLEIAADLSPSLHGALLAVGPVRVTRQMDEPLVERLCRAVAGQQLSTKAASTIWGRVLAETRGKAFSRYLISATAEQLRGCGLSRSKVKAMQSISTASESGQLDADALSRLPHDERATQLTSIWGVGQWTADMLGIFYFGDKDIWPDGDLTAWKTLERLTSKRRKTILTAARFAPYRSYLAVSMYRIADVT